MNFSSRKDGNQMLIPTEGQCLLIDVTTRVESDHFNNAVYRQSLEMNSGMVGGSFFLIYC